MAVNILGAESNAFFYQSWNVAGIALSVAVMTSLSLFAEGSQPDGKLSRHLKNSVRITLVLLVPLVLIIGLLGDKILLILGREYSAGGTKLLWLLAPAAIPTSINQLYMGIVRVEKKLKQILLITGAIAVSTLGLSWILMGRLGIVGIGVAWLTSQTAVMLVLLPAFMRRMRNQTVEKKVRDT